MENDFFKPTHPTKIIENSILFLFEGFPYSRTEGGCLQAIGGLTTADRVGAAQKPVGGGGNNIKNLLTLTVRAFE